MLAPFARRVCLAFPIAGRSGAALPRHRPADPRRLARTARPRASAFGIAPDETCVLVFGGSLGARSINLAALEAFAGRARFACCTWRGAATTPSWPRASFRAGMTCASTSTRRTSPTRSPPPTWWSRAPAARCSRSPRTGVPAILVPYPHAAGDHQSDERALDVRRGRRDHDPRRRADRRAPGRRGRRRCSPTARASTAMASRLAAPGPARGRAAEVADELLRGSRG